jgi:hypothetical protein
MSAASSPAPGPSDSAGGAGPEESRIEAFLEEIEQAAERLRRLPLTELTPEAPFRADWRERPA